VARVCPLVAMARRGLGGARVFFRLIPCRQVLGEASHRKGHGVPVFI
jgi:hypothetical protein